MIKPSFASIGLVFVSLALAQTGCGGGGRATPFSGSGGHPAGGGTAGATPGLGGGPPADSGGTPVVVTDPAAHAAAVVALKSSLASDRPADATAFQARWSTHYLASLPYD